MKAYEILLQTLPLERQMIFGICYEENLSTKTISDQIEISRKTVQNQLGKAVEVFKHSSMY